MLGALSPSRAGDFMTCPLLYRFRTIDRLPEPFSPDAVRGTVVHKVLEDLFDLPAGERTPEQARDLLVPAWDAILEAEPEIAEMFGTEGPAVGDVAGVVPRRCWTATSPSRTPRRLEPAERELYVETLTDTKLLLRGFVDRVDIAPDGSIRVVDYKTGSSPGEWFEAKALFQMKFYALVIWRTRGVLPSMLQLVYLGNAEMLRYVPDEQDLLATERKVEALWRAIVTAARDRRLAPQQEPAVRLVRPPGDLPRVGRHPAAAARGRSGYALRVRSTGVSPTRVARKVRPSPGGTSTWFGTTYTVQPADSAERAPVSESSIATHQPDRRRAAWPPSGRAPDRACRG